MRVYAKNNNDLCSDFRMVNRHLKNNDKERNVDTFEECDRVISTIRNKVSHFELSIKPSKNGNIEDYELIFEASCNYYFKIKCKDYINFITDPLFTNHNVSNEKIETISTFEDYKNSMIKMIEEYEK
jgi:hypothetical protein